MWTAYRENGKSLPDGCGPKSHYLNNETCEGFAITEGWAEFMECVIDNKPEYLAETTCGAYGNIETNNWHLGDDCIADNSGAIVEGAVASVLWDIFDDINDGENDAMNSGFHNIWNIMKSDNPTGINSFWDKWFQKGYNQKSGMKRVYFSHGINKNNAPSISLTSPSNGLRTSDTTPTFQWSGYDGDGDPLSNTIYIDDDSSPFSNPLKKVAVGEAGTYTLKDPEALTDGEYYWGVETTDGMASPVKSSTRKFTIDRCYGVSCPSSGWYCNGDMRENRNYYCSEGSCLYAVLGQENCNIGDGWYNYGDFGTSCSRMDDPTAEYRNYYCSSGSCTYSVTSAKDCDDMDGYYGGGDLGCGTYDDPSSQKRDYYVTSSGTCAYNTAGCPVKDCDDQDGWYGGGDAGPSCAEMADPESDRRDYYVKQNTNECRYCVVESKNCNSLDGWYGGGNTQTTSCGQKDDDATAFYRDYYTAYDTDRCEYTTQSCQTKDCDNQDGWYGGGDFAGCGEDPSSYWRDYYVSQNSNLCTYIESCMGSYLFDCDAKDQCHQTCEGDKVVSGLDYYVVPNSDTCAQVGGAFIEDCNLRGGSLHGECGAEEWKCVDGTCAFAAINKDDAKCVNSCDGDIRKIGYCDDNYLCSERLEDCNEKNYYEDFVGYCTADDVRKHRKFHDYYCQPDGCEDSWLWTDDQLMEKCSEKPSQESDGGIDYSNGGYVLDYSGCADGICTGTTYKDTCTSESMLTEYYAALAAYGSEGYNCDNLDECDAVCPGCSFKDYLCIGDVYGYCGHTVRDPDVAETYCQKCNQKWMGTFCCGDDAGEVFRNRQCEDLGCSAENDIACCASDVECVFEFVCYPENQLKDVNGDNVIEVCKAGFWKKACNNGEKVCEKDVLKTCENSAWKEVKCEWGCSSGRCNPAMSYSKCRSECRYGHRYIQACFDTYAGMKYYAKYCPPPT